MSGEYERAFRESVADPERFWGAAAEKVQWYQTYDRVLTNENPPFYRWFEGGIVNSCYNALDYHVENGLKDRIALIYDSPVTKTVKRYTYGELRDQVARCAGGSGQLGVAKGDRVVIYMPMIPEAVIAMLACARIGAVHSVVFGGFAARELAARIEDAKPRVVISASCGIEVNRIIPYQPLLESALDMCSFKPSACVIVQRPESAAMLRTGRDIPGMYSWMPILSTAFPCLPLIRSISSTRPAPRENPKVWCGTTGGISLR